MDSQLQESKQKLRPVKTRRGGSKFGRVDQKKSDPGFILVTNAIDHAKYIKFLKRRNPDLREFEYDQENHEISTPGQGKENHDPNAAVKLAWLGPVIACDTRELSPPMTVAKNTPLNTAKIYDLLVSPPEEAIKRGKHSFTRKKVAAIKRKFKGKKRNPTQEQAMCAKEKGRVPAREVAIAEGHVKKARQWEWTHLVAHRFKGKEGQNDENMVLATQQCNTLMMFVEDEVDRLLKHEDMGDDDQVTLEVTAYCLKGSHKLQKMVYRIQAPALGFDLTLSFYGLMRYQPQANMEDYYGALFDYVLDEKQPLAFVETPQQMRRKESDRRQSPECTPIKGDPKAFEEIFAKREDGNSPIVKTKLF